MAVSRSRKKAGKFLMSVHSLCLVFFLEFTSADFQPPTTKTASILPSIQELSPPHTIQPYALNFQNSLLTKRANQPVNFRSSNLKPAILPPNSNLPPKKQPSQPPKLKPQPNKKPPSVQAKKTNLQSKKQASIKPNIRDNHKAIKQPPKLNSRPNQPDAALAKVGDMPPKLHNEYAYNLNQKVNSSANQDALGGQYMTDTILDNAPWSIKLLLLNGQDEDQSGRKHFGDVEEPYRSVGIEALTAARRQGEGPPPIHLPDDDNNMRLKLFRLMYETVRDSDLKVKRAELICKHYKNSTAFEVGYLMGEVQEKFDVINEFAGTLKKYYMKWRPIEHINAYEQIANNAIQITHLIDLIKSISKGNTTSFK